MNVTNRILAVLFCLLAAAAVVAGVRVIRTAQSAELQVEDQGPDGPSARTEAFFSALRRRDYPAAYACLSNDSDLGLERSPEDPTAALFWEAEQDVWDFEVLPGHEMDGKRLNKRVRVRALDAPAVAALLGERLQERLNALVEEAEQVEDVYDESGNYREDVLKLALRDAAEEAVAAAGEHTLSREITVHLDYVDGAWLIAADNELLSALTGGAVR